MCRGLLLLSITLCNKNTHTHIRQNSPGLGIGPSQRPLAVRYTTYLRDIYPCHRRVWNAQSKHVNDRRPTPLTARPKGSASFIIIMFILILVNRYSHRILPCGGSFILIQREFLAPDVVPEITVPLNTHAINLRIS